MSIVAAKEYSHPALTVDTALFSVRDNELVALTVRRRREPFAAWWALPGDYIRTEEALDECSARVLSEQTGIEQVYLEQLYTFASHYPGRWGRVFNIAYFGLVPFTALHPRLRADLFWQPLSHLPPLAFNHGKILTKARHRLAAKIEYTPIALELLPEFFTLAEAQAVHEAIRGQALDKRNFRRRLLALDCLDATGEQLQRGASRPARLYRLKPDRKTP